MELSYVSLSPSRSCLLHPYHIASQPSSMLVDFCRHEGSVLRVYRVRGKCVSSRHEGKTVSACRPCQRPLARFVKPVVGARARSHPYLQDLHAQQKEVYVCRLHVVVTVEQRVRSGLPWRCVGFAVFLSLSQGEGGCTCVNSVTLNLGAFSQEIKIGTHIL